MRSRPAKQMIRWLLISGLTLLGTSAAAGIDLYIMVMPPPASSVVQAPGHY